MPWFNTGIPQLPSWRGKPYHMLASEVPIWYRYLDKNQDKYSKLYYNFALTLRTPPKVYPDNIVKSWMQSTAKRIDVVGIRVDGSIDIIEVSDHAGLRAIGQIITYKDLWNQIKPMKGKINPIIVCEYANPDMKFMAKKYGFKIIEV